MRDFLVLDFWILFVCFPVIDLTNSDLFVCFVFYGFVLVLELLTGKQ